MKTRLILLPCLLLMIPLSSQAQFLKKLKEKVTQTMEETVSEKIEKKAQETTENALDSLLDGNQKKSKRKNSSSKSLGVAESYSDLNQEGMPDFMENLNISNMMEMVNTMSEAEIASSYVFDTQITTEISSPEQKALMDFYFGDNILMSSIDMAPGIRVIYDYNNNSIVTLIDEDKTVIGLPLDFAAEITDSIGFNAETEEEIDVASRFKKTGRSKNILGFRAEEYIAEDEDVIVNFWFSEEVPIDNSKMLEGMEKMGSFFAFDFAIIKDKKYRDGLILEMTATEKQNRTTVKTKVIKLMTQQHITINTSNYNPINLQNEND